MSGAEDIIREVTALGGMTENNLRIVLNGYEITKKSNELAVIEDKRSRALQMFFVTKRVEGCSPRTITYYQGVLKRFFTDVNCNLETVTSDVIRYYIAIRSERDGLGKVSQGNELHVLKSFFGWCTTEDYIAKDPTQNVKPIKPDQRIKKAFSEIELEKLRKSVNTKRDLAILETLYSTGCRVSELCGMDRKNIDGNEITVFGKGGKERVCYLNAKSLLAISDYLSERTDNNPALFVGLDKPHERLTYGAVDVIVRNLGKKAGVEKCHPHRFRRTAATIALNRGMPIDQVQKMLGHSVIGTTTIYAQSDMENVKASHKKYVV